MGFRVQVSGFRVSFSEVGEDGGADFGFELAGG